MRGTLGLLLAAAVAAACSSCGDNPGPGPGPVISVGGTYLTEVTMVSNTCPGQTVEQHSTTVSHVPGSTSLSLTHAGSTYTGTLNADASFTTPTVTQVFGGIAYEIRIQGQFTETTVDALVHVDANRTPRCSFSARWAGPKDGDPNTIP